MSYKYNQKLPVTLYRYDIGYSNADDPETSIILIEYRVIKETDASYCIEVSRRTKWIRKTSYNAYAHPNKDKAKAHFIRRTNIRLRWFEYWTRECETALKLIEENV